VYFIANCLQTYTFQCRENVWTAVVYCQSCTVQYIGQLPCACIQPASLSDGKMQLVGSHQFLMSADNATLWTSSYAATPCLPMSICCLILPIQAESAMDRP